MRKQRLHVPLKLLAIVSFSLTLWFAVLPSGIMRAATDGSITGVVIDDAGKALRGAAVTATLENMSISRFTDASGKYQISGLKPGNYRVSVTAWGYAAKSVDKEISSSASDVAFSLRQS